MASTIQFLKHPIDLLATLWDSPPDIPPPVNLTAAPGLAVPTNPEPILAPSGLCGWVSPEPGTPGNFVCQALGTSMPGVVFIVSLTVMGITAFFLIRYLLRSAAIATELEELAKTFEKMKTSAPEEWALPETSEKIIRAILASGERAPPLEAFGKSIRTALLPIPGGKEPRVTLKAPVSTLAREVRHSERWSGRALAEALPGWLTAIGLLTTFLAILLGLQGVKVLTNLEVRGIGGLVNGLSGKFFSSIVALGCAISITILHYFISGQMNALWNRVTDRLQDLLPHLSVERAFVAMLSRQSGQGS